MRIVQLNSLLYNTINILKCRTNVEENKCEGVSKRSTVRKLSDNPQDEIMNFQ